MKKILSYLVLALFGSSASAAQVVPVIWPFSIGSTGANHVRTILSEANKLQNKYTFILENKPGAGGYIAARYVQNYNGLAVLATTTSFFTRPVYYPNESHKVQDFKPFYVLCSNQPILVISSKFKNVNELSKQSRITIGANLGSVTESIAKELEKALPNTQVDIVPFQGTLPGTMEVLGGRLDLNVELAADIQQHIDAGKLNVVGSTGRVDHKNITTFSSQGYRGFGDLTMNYVMYVPNANSSVTEEFHKIFADASNAAGDKINDLYSKDYCTKSTLNLNEINKSYENSIKYWKLN